MSEREMKRRSAPPRRDEEQTEEVASKSDQGDRLKADLDNLLDEIDEVLEDNAEEFVRNYVQKGGE